MVALPTIASRFCFSHTGPTVAAVLSKGGVMIIVKEIGLSLLIAVGAVTASDVVVLALEWFGVLFQ
jgi:hypothetical protein